MSEWTIIAVLIGMLLPAVQKARAAAQRTDCQNRMKQLGLGLHSYCDAVGTFPSGVVTSGGSPTLCPSGGTSGPPWTVFILPFLEQENIFSTFNMTGTFGGLFVDESSAVNASAQLVRNQRFECPADPNSNHTNCNCNYYGIQGGGASNSSPGICFPSSSYPNRVQAHNGILFNNSNVPITSITDGTSNCYMVGESRYTVLETATDNGSYLGEFYATWASGYYTVSPGPLVQNLAVCMNAINSSNVNPAVTTTWDLSYTNTLGSYHSNGCNMTMADGSVQFVTNNINLTVFQERGIINDGLPVAGDPSNSD